jgi:ABC-type branched-subunit amino acid transport system ATPase component
MLAGALRLDSGEMTLDGAHYAPQSTVAASARGVALVHQEITVNRSLTIAENIFIDRLRHFAGALGFIDRKRMASAAQAILDRIGVEKRPAGGIYQHIAHATDDGYRIIEIWDDKAGLELFLQDTLFPAAQELQIQREMTIMTRTLHNIFVPRIGELTALANDAPGGPVERAKA